MNEILKNIALSMVYIQAIAFLFLSTGAILYGSFLLWKKNAILSEWFFDYTEHRRMFKMYMDEINKPVESEVPNAKP